MKMRTTLTLCAAALFGVTIGVIAVQTSVPAELDGKGGAEEGRVSAAASGVTRVSVDASLPSSASLDAPRGSVENSPSESTPPELTSLELGAMIYRTGKRPSGEPLQVSISLPGAAAAHRQSAEFSPCIGCHGEDGATSIEGGIRVPAIRLADLAMPHARSNSTGRVHRPYDKALVRRAITMGVDASGNPLHPLMPRYELTASESAALVEYLDHLGRIPAVGVEDETIRLGLALPSGAGDDSERARWFEGVRNAARAHFDRVDADGGIFGRTITWVESIDPALLDDCFLVIATDEIADRLDPNVPVHRVPASPHPSVGEVELPARAFALLPSRADLFRVAVDHVIDVLHLDGVSFVLLQREGPTNEVQSRAVRGQTGRKLGCDVTELRASEETVDLAEALRGRLSTSGPKVVLVEPDFPHLPAVLELLARTPSVARIYVPGLVRGWDVGGTAQALSEKLLSVSPLPIPDSQRAEQDFIATLRTAGLTMQDRIPALFAYTWGTVIAEGLRSCGRRVTRDRYVRGLEALHGFCPSPFAPLTLDASSRVAALGGQVVRWSLEDARWIALAEWKEPR